MSDPKDPINSTEPEPTELGTPETEVTSDEVKAEPDSVEAQTDQYAEPAPIMKSELDILKERAIVLGVKHHPSIGVKNLKIKIEEALKPKKKKAPEPPVQAKAIPSQGSKANRPVSSVTDPSTLYSEYPPHHVHPLSKEDLITETKGARYARVRKECLRLVRVKVTCMNPNKKAWEGEVYTVSNRACSVKKYVPFSIEEGWHIPTILYKHMKERKCQIFYNERNSKGVQIKRSKLISELSIELLPDLTEQEMKDLAIHQALNNSIDN